MSKNNRGVEAIMNRSPQESSREYVYRLIRSNIMDLKYAPGSTISENEIAEQLNISRTPIREAIIRLVQENLIDVFPQRGTYVSLIDIRHVEESKFIRETLERRVMRLACVEFQEADLFQLQKFLVLQELCIQEKQFFQFYEHDSNLHGAIFAGCNKARTWEMIQQMNTHYNRVRILGISHAYELPELLAEHQAMVAAIKNQNPVAGKRALDSHLNKVRMDLTKMMKDFPEYFKKNF
ncbi:MAG: GntR family transcriptional regulator [Negativicutes bacterium]